MANVLKLVQRDDFTSDISDLDLDGFADGIDLAAGGWTPGMVDDTTGHVIEAMTLRIKGTSVNDLATNVQGLANMVRLVGLSGNAAERYGIWLRRQIDTESKAFQSYIVKAQHTPITSPLSYGARKNFALSEYSLGLERMPYWEDTSSIAGGFGSLSAIGGMGAFLSPATVYGDQPARLAICAFTPYVAANYTLTKAWIGFRSTQYGNPANFQPYWSLRKSYGFDADTTGGTTNADATAKDGYKTVTTFATHTDLIDRTDIAPTMVSANPQDQRGTFKVLLRAKNSAAGTVRVRLADCFVSSQTSHYQSRVPVASTSWQFYDLGIVTIPSPGNLVYGGDPVNAYSLRVSAERVSGACNLEMDCLVLIPYDEWSCYVPDASIYLNAPAANACFVTVKPDEIRKAYTFDQTANLTSALSTPYISGKGLPLGATVNAVVAAQRSTSSVLADLVGVQTYYYQRWDQLRGNE